MSSTGPSDPKPPKPRSNARVGLICAAIFVGMTGAAYAAVPLYKAFCQATGFGGTVRKADTAPDTVLNKTVTVRFDANVRDLPWTFRADQTAQTVKIGETKLAFFTVTNRSDKPVTARAVYNVSPDQAGAYFQKLQCFCFSEQTIAARATVQMPVLYFIDPKYAQDIDTKGEPVVTLSYTFYPAVDGAKQTQAGKGDKKG